MSSSMVVAEHLSKSFGTKRVLDDISFTVDTGDVVGVLGKNGAGKSTLLELILGFTPASAGRVQILGHDTCKMPGAVKARIGFVPQSDELIDQITAREQLRIIGSFYANWEGEWLEHLSSDWELNLDQRVREMSVGQRQKLSILLALGHRPDLLLLDEPVASLDPLARRQFLEQIVAVAADGKRSVVFSSHIVSDIERLANKIWILKSGHLYWRGGLDDLKESIVRIHVRRAAPFPNDFRIESAFSQSVSGTHVTAVVCGWNEQRYRDIARSIDGDIEVEPLALEEIFVELHR